METTKSTRRSLLASGALGAAVLALPHLGRAETEKKYHIALSNSFMGNKWRLEMENVFKAALQMEPYKSEVVGSWYNSGNNVGSQSQQISNLISQRVDAILIDAASPTGLDGILNEAHSRGVLVVAFDNLVKTQTAVKVITSQFDEGRGQAEWLAKRLNGKGNIIMVTGVAGTYYDEQMNLGAESVWKENPGIKIVARYPGKWDESIAQLATTSLLPSLPKIDGIWSQGGSLGVLSAFTAAKHLPLPPIAGGDSNGLRLFMLGYKRPKVEGYATGQPPYVSVVALELARQILAGKRKRGDVTLPLHALTNKELKVGVNVFPNLSDIFYGGVSAGGPNPTVELCVGAFLHGEPCKGPLVVNLPPVGA